MKPPCSIVTGFLGSGKTSLLLHVMTHGFQGRSVAIILNELGELNIDGPVFTDLDCVESMVELNSGCVCCTVGEYQLSLAVDEIIEEVQPTQIIMETTGVAEPLPIIERLKAFGVPIDSVITVVDVTAYPGAGATRAVIAAQVEGADFIVLNKVDLVDAARARAVEQEIRQRNRRALLIRTRYGVVEPGLLFGTAAGDLRAPETRPLRWTGEHRGPGHGQFRSFSYKSDHDVDLALFKNFLSNLPQEIYRAKGLLRICGEPSMVLFNYTCGRYDFRSLPMKLDDTTPTQVVFIGKFPESVRELIVTYLQLCLSVSPRSG